MCFETNFRGIITFDISKCYNYCSFFIGIFIEIELIKLSLGVSQPPGNYSNCKYVRMKILSRLVSFASVCHETIRINIDLMSPAGKSNFGQL